MYPDFHVPEFQRIAHQLNEEKWNNDELGLNVESVGKTERGERVGGIKNGGFKGKMGKRVRWAKWGGAGQERLLDAEFNYLID